LSPMVAPKPCCCFSSPLKFGNASFARFQACKRNSKRLLSVFKVFLSYFLTFRAPPAPTSTLYIDFSIECAIFLQQLASTNLVSVSDHPSPPFFFIAVSTKRVLYRIAGYLCRPGHPPDKPFCSQLKRFKVISRKLNLLPSFLSPLPLFLNHGIKFF